MFLGLKLNLKKMFEIKFKKIMYKVQYFVCIKMWSFNNS